MPVQFWLSFGKINLMKIIIFTYILMLISTADANADMTIRHISSDDEFISLSDSIVEGVVVSLISENTEGEGACFSKTYILKVTNPIKGVLQKGDNITIGLTTRSPIIEVADKQLLLLSRIEKNDHDFYDYCKVTQKNNIVKMDIVYTDFSSRGSLYKINQSDFITYNCEDSSSLFLSFSDIYKKRNSKGLLKGECGIMHGNYEPLKNKLKATLVSTKE